MLRCLLSLLFTLIIYSSWSQQIIDPCFSSVNELGFFYGSEDVLNICGCNDYYLAANMMEWNGTEWLGRHENSEVSLPPPNGCSNRAVWCGYSSWTPGGEGIALLLDRGLEPGKTYSYRFTYASDGAGKDSNFSPMVYTHNAGIPYFSTAFYTGRLPGTDNWKTDSITFTAQPQQDGHRWIILRAFESSGIILSDCESRSIMTSESLGDDRVICENSEIKLEVTFQKYFQYSWNTGETTNSISVSTPGDYSVTVTFGTCSFFSEVTIDEEDCEIRLAMPNIFTPNGDSYNPVFIPIEHNYIESGRILIYNRWGKEIFQGDLFTGWNGEGVASGIYYYEIIYKARSGAMQKIKGWVSLTR